MTAEIELLISSVLRKGFYGSLTLNVMDGNIVLAETRETYKPLGGRSTRNIEGQREAVSADHPR